MAPGPQVFLGAELERLDALVKTSNLLVTINSSANFLVYVLFGDKFKRVFLATVCRPVLARLPCCARRPASPDGSRDDSCSAPERMSLRAAAPRRARRPPARRADPAPTVYYPAPPPLTDLSDLHNGHAADHF